MFVEGKLERLPENLVVLDAAVKLCQCEIVLRKSNGKAGTETVTESSFLNSLKMFPSLANLSSGNTANATAPPPVAVIKSSDDVIIITPPTSTVTTIASTTPMPTFTVPSTTATSTTSMFASASQRPRGRPPGSKNALSKSLDWSQSKMSPATIAAILGIYSSPSMATQYSSPAEVSALLEEYYKLQASISPTSLLSALDNIGAPSMYASTQPKAFNAAGASNKLPKVDMKKPIPPLSTVVSNPTSTVISVGSGQLTITPSSYASSSKSSKNLTRPHETPMTCDSGADFDIESVIPKSELLTNKMFSDMSKLKSSMQFPQIGKNVTIPKDLPKSLSITPAPPIGYPSVNYGKKKAADNLPHVTLHPEPRKQKKTHKRAASVPFADFTAKQPAGLYGDVLAGYQQMLNMNMMSMMARNIPPNPMLKPAAFSQSSSKQTKTQSSSNRKSETKFEKALPFPLPGKQLYDAHSSSMSSRSFPPSTMSLLKNQATNKNQQAAHRADTSPLKFGTTPMTAHSPHKLPPPIARQPSPSMHQTRY